MNFKKQAFQADAAKCVKLTDVFAAAAPSSAPVADDGGVELGWSSDEDETEWLWSPLKVGYLLNKERWGYATQEPRNTWRAQAAVVKKIAGVDDIKQILHTLLYFSSAIC